MFLKRLELQGFKTFASKTELVFDTGMTAVVGPNGSGKSNVADAVRWVMGEQSARALRIKRSDDVIFAGTSSRSRVGMAEVSITLDNSTKWLPVDFTEVTITRRAYRSGETEYLINKSRVRLRDVVDMLLAGNVGQNNYTVIGQGAIDAALSLRPEERRELFEEAADIKRYQIRRNDTLNKLQTTDTNLVRIRDLMAEISPRLQALQEQAHRAQEQERLLQELRGYLAAWYVHRWNEASAVLRLAIAGENEALRVLAEAEGALQEIDDRLAIVRQRESSLRSQLSEWHRQSSALHSQAEALERRSAVARATLDSTSRQHQEILDEVADLQAQLAAQQQSVSDAEAEQETMGLAQAGRVAGLDQLEQQASVLETRRSEAQQRLESAEAEVFAAASAIAAAESGMTALAGRRQTAGDEIKQRRIQLAQHEQSAAAVEQALAGLRATLAAHDADVATQTGQRPAAQAAITAVRKEYEAAQTALNAAHDERRSLELRLETLSRLHESLAGYDAGVRSVLNASRGGSLKGIVGTVASLLRVPSQYEAAIGAALGSHEQDIVTETWQDAEAAVELLRQSRGGRSTFLPLDVIRGRSNSERIDGAIGWAADLVQAPELYGNITAYLLGRVLLVNDLPAARRILDRPAMRSVSSIVTLAGDIVRPGGAITGGSPSARSSGLLEREREMVDLPKRITTAKATEQAQAQKMAVAQAALRQTEERLVGLDGRLAALRRAHDEQASGMAQRQRELERWQQEMAWARRQIAALEQSLAGLGNEETALVARLTAQRRQQAQGQGEVARLRQALAEMAGSELASRLAEARTAAALGEQELKARQAMLDSLQREAERLAGRVTARERRAAELASEIAAAEAEIERALAELHALSGAIATARERITPAEAALEGIEKERTALLSQETQTRQRHSTLERASTQAAVDVQRARNDVGRLQAQIEAEEGLGVRGFGLAEDDIKRLLDEMAVPVQLSLAAPDFRQPVEPQTAVASPELLKRRVDGLRSQLRHLGAVNPNAVAEYDETLKRYTFLASQSDDLDKAVKSLRTVIAELDELMHTRFAATFEAISREFRRHFTTLFGGGTARLTLTDPDDVAETGVEIVAQPPGKRLQSLALLSGGERALTATALLFAILTVNPTPFCVLDEVDAALDDANVGRFTDALRGLAQRTQFIVITHNKGTMEMASALYGVSMNADGTSQVLSLKLEDIPA